LLPYLQLGMSIWSFRFSMFTLLFLKLIDQPVWNLVKNDVFTYWLFRSKAKK
jgi:hypothetical protein